MKKNLYDVYTKNKYLGWLALIIIAAGLLMPACTKKSDTPAEGAATVKNPFFADYNTPYNVPTFDLIKAEHFVPAFEEGMQQHKADIDAIVENTEAPNFENTIVALDRSGKLLSKVSPVFYGLSSANTNDDIKKIQVEMSPRLAKHRDEINLNKALFERVKAVYEQRDQLNLNDEQMYLLENLYKGYVRSGAKYR